MEKLSTKDRSTKGKPVVTKLAKSQLLMYRWSQNQ